jgi:ATP-dependent 26S proteasome regulatory subunit
MNLSEKVDLCRIGRTVDNKEGYTIENVVTSCGNCNNLKATLNREEFLEKVRRIYENIQKKENPDAAEGFGTVKV